MKKPSEIEDDYERLGISRDASEEEKRKAYINLAKIYHPNNYPLDEQKQKECHLEFIAIGESYERITKGKLNEDYSNLDNEEKFDYFQSFFGITSDDFVRISDELSKSDNEAVKYYGELIKKVLSGLF